MIDGFVATTTPVQDLPEFQRPTLDNLVKHYRKFGLDNSHTGYRGRPEFYKSYRTLAEDALVKTGRAYLTQPAYVFLVDAVGYGEFKAEAEKHWLEVREEDDPR